MRTITKKDLIEGLKRGDIERQEAVKALIALKPKPLTEEGRKQEVVADKVETVLIAQSQMISKLVTLVESLLLKEDKPIKIDMADVRPSSYTLTVVDHDSNGRIRDVKVTTNKTGVMQ